MVDLVEHEENRPADAIELLIQFVERVSSPESPLRESTGVFRKSPADKAANPGSEHRGSPEERLAGSNYSPTLLSALFNSKSSRTTSLSATRYRGGDVFGTSSMSSTSHKRSV